MGKLENWLSYQQRHLDTGTFGEWVKSQQDFALRSGNAKQAARIQAFLDRGARIPAAIKQLEDLEKQIVKKVMAPACDRASKWLASIEKSSTPNRSGTLRQAIGSTSPKTYLAALKVWIASGPRRGYGRVVTASMKSGAQGGVKLHRTSKKFSEEHANMSTFANPIKYAAFLITGHKGAVAGKGKGGKSKAKALFDSFTGRFFGHSTKPAAPRDFMAMARSAAPSAANMATAEMQIEIAKLAPDYYAGRKD
jgi:hypothetical protein